MHILTVNKLCKSFGGLKAINNLDFQVNEGEIVGIIGPNGSGKTTSLNLITGFLKPNSGSIQFRGEEIGGLQRNMICRKGIARTFQLNKPFMEFSAVQNILVGRIYGRVPSRNLKDAEIESMEILEKIGLEKKAQVLVKDMTVMERKKLELGRALATRPYLLLLDELMAGLNLVEADDVCNFIGEIRNSGTTIIIVEHIVKAVTCISDRILVLNMGEKIAEGTPNEVIHNPKVIEVYLGTSHA